MGIGLVLGAGGVSGGSWLTGALEGLEMELGWDPAGAERIVGTSVGAVVGAMLSSGVSPSYLAAHCAGKRPGPISQALARAEASRLDETFRRQRRLADRGPGSWALALSTLSRPRQHPPGAVLAGWLPRGLTTTDPIKDAVRMASDRAWDLHDGFHAVACDYRTGRREALGPGDAPLPDAVA